MEIFFLLNTCTEPRKYISLSKTNTMKVQLTYTIESEQTVENPTGLQELTKDFEVKEKINGAYQLVNGWFVDYRYSPQGDWEIYNGSEYISTCPRPKEI